MIGTRIDNNITNRLLTVPLDSLLAGFRQRPGEQAWSVPNTRAATRQSDGSSGPGRRDQKSREALTTKYSGRSTIRNVG